MKKQIPKAKGFGVVKPEHFNDSEIRLKIPELNSQYGNARKLLTNSRLNFIMRKFIEKLAERQLADKSILSDLEFMIEDYLINYEFRFENSDNFYDDFENY